MLWPETCHDIFFPPYVGLFAENARRLILFRPPVHEPHIDFDLSFIGGQGGSDAALHVLSTWAKRLAERSSKIQRFEKGDECR